MSDGVNKTENFDDWEAQLAEYMLGGMEAGAAAAFESQLNECTAHVRLAQQYTQTVGVIGLAASAANPPAGHKDRFMARLASTQQETPTVAPAAPALSVLPSAKPQTVTPVTPAVPAPDKVGSAGAQVTDLDAYRQRKQARMSWPAIAAIAAAFVLMIGGAVWITKLIDGGILNIPQGVIAFPVKGAGPQEQNATAIGFLNTNTNEAHILTNGLQPLAANKIYELWWLPKAQGAAPVAAGTFTVDAAGKAEHKSKSNVSVSDYAGVAVTLEDKPGGEAPKGDIVLVASW